ncbi:MAG: TonB-dependent receptor [Bacteroidota bacterium]|nr:TonB-dependent receptor [Bacteroidota bacterium]
MLILSVFIAGSLEVLAQEQEQVEELKEATVTARHDLVRTDADKLTYYVEADPFSEGANLVDVIRKVPMLSVNSDGEVLLNGSKDFKVLVNGRSTGMLVRNFSQLIKTIPASSVKEIQVFTNPPVKYDAEGIGGVINIVMSRRLKSGYSGSLSLMTNSRGMAGGSGYLSAQLGKVTLGSEVSLMNYPSPEMHGITDIENIHVENNHFSRLDFGIEQKSYTRDFSLETTYEPDSLNLFTVSGWVDFHKESEIFDITESFRDRSGNKTMEMTEPSKRLDRYDTFSAEAAYQRTFQGDGGILTLSYSADGNPNSIDNNVIVVPVLNCEEYHRHSFNTAHTIQQIGQIDYYATLKKKHQVEAGGKYTLRNHEADSKDEVWDYAADMWTVDNSNVNDLDYRQHILAAYASYGYLFPALTLKAGARMEYTRNRGLSKSMSGNMTFDNSNFNIVPYLNLAWRIDEDNSLSLSYTRRLGRPDVVYLNPYVFEESPYSRSHGNPDLRTVVSDALTMNYHAEGEKWGLTARTYGSLCNNKIEYLSKVNQNGVKISTYENSVRHAHADFMTSLDWTPSSVLTLQTTAKAGYDSYHAPALCQRNGGFSWSVNFSGNVSLWKGAMAYAVADAGGGARTLQRTYHGIDYSYYLGLRQGLMRNRLILSALVNMPFQNVCSGAVRYTSTESYRQRNESFVRARQIMLSVSWRFGKTTIDLKRARKSKVDDKL